MWRSADTAAARQDDARAELAGVGLIRDGRVSGALVESLRVLCSGGVEFVGYVDTVERSYRLYATSINRDAVFACYAPDSGQMLLRPANPDDLAGEVVRELPEWHTTRGPSLSAQEADLNAAMSGRADGRGDVRRVVDLYRLPRAAAGQFYVRSRAQRRRDETATATFVDNDRGRWLSYFTDGVPGQRYLTTKSGTHDALVTRLVEVQQAVGVR
jgi:hypothetical protein